MNDLFLLLIIIGLICVPICLVLAVVRFFKKKNSKFMLKLSGVFFAIFFVGILGFSMTMTKDDKNATKASTTQESSTDEAIDITEAATVPETTQIETVAQLSMEDTFVQALSSNPDVDSEVAQSTFYILTDKLGFSKISDIKNPMGTLFEIKADGYGLKITVSDQLYKVICGSYTMYEAGEAKYTKGDLDDRTVGNDGPSYYTIAQEIITSNLKNPSSAKFASMDNCTIARNKDIVAVKGFVDATNSFDAQIRNEFVVQFRVIDLASYSYDAIYINVNGESSGEYVEMK